MKKMQWILGTGLFLVIASIIYFSQSSQKIGLLGILPTPTLDMKSQFQLLQPTPNPQQAQAAQEQAQQQAQTQQQPQNQTNDVQGPPIASAEAVIKTSKGDITISLLVKDAPKTVLNFMNKAGNNFYNNLIFHRVEDWVIQGGDPKGDGTGGGSMLVEFNQIPFGTGSVGMASHGDGRVQNDSQFFITKSVADWLDQKYTNFGKVTNGMDVVNKIQIGDKILGITINTNQTEGGLPVSK